MQKTKRIRPLIQEILLAKESCNLTGILGHTNAQGECQFFFYLGYPMPEMIHDWIKEIFLIQDLIVSLMMSTSPSFKDPSLGKKDYVMWPIPLSPYPFFLHSTAVPIPWFTDIIYIIYYLLKLHILSIQIYWELSVSLLY